MDHPAISQGRALENRQGVSLVSRKLREKLLVAFALMSVVPLLVLIYIVVNYVFPRSGVAMDLSLVVGLTIAISLLGFAVVRGFVLPVIRMASDVQAIAEGKLDRRIEVTSKDEVGMLGASLNQVTQKIREDMRQLRIYGEQTKHLNLEINRRILSLSHLMQVSNLITQSAKIDEIIPFILEKMTQVEELDNCFLERAGDSGAFIVRAIRGGDDSAAQKLLHARLEAPPWPAPIFEGRRPLVIDADHPSSTTEAQWIGRHLGMVNAVCQPLGSLGQEFGLLISANRKEGFVFHQDCLDLLKMFAEQMSIAIENDLLAKRAEELKVVDELTGLYNAGYMRSRLEEEVRRAARFHRPCAVLFLALDDFHKFQDLYGNLASESLERQVAEFLKGQVTEVDRVGRMGAGEFAVIFPERNKREAIEMAEAMRHRMETKIFTNGAQRLPSPITISGGLSENPIDGPTGEALMEKAMEAVKSAKRQGKNRVVAS